MLIDTHAHLNFKQFDRDREEVIKRSLRSDIWMLNVGSQHETSKKAVEIAEKYKQGVYAAVGIHPIYTEGPQRSLSIKELAKAKKVVAIGEIGLDYKAEYVSFKERQKQVFLEQLDLAKELNLPIIFHCRFAHNDLIEILDRGPSSAECRGRASALGVIHCFTGTWEQARKYLDMGLYLGFNGIIFKFNLDEVIKKTPLDKILLETDCPYLTPLPTRASAKAGHRNEPLYIKHIAKKIAEIKNINYKEVADITTKNAKKLFKI